MGLRGAITETRAALHLCRATSRRQAFRAVLVTRGPLFLRLCSGRPAYLIGYLQGPFLEFNASYCSRS